MVPASLPREAGEEQYSARARAVRVGGRYALGLPWYRLQGSQAMGGGPMPDATPWEQSAQGGDGSDVVFAYRETLAAPGALIAQDDTTVRMRSLSEAISRAPAPAK